ncbi:DNA polymerase I [Candidatus Saccharibacteria bacterium]|nr:DNA polymerase I [Candidatus Saccharibacteria bacterium]
MKKLVIIDGKSVFYRGYYAMGALSTSDGTPTGGVYGFAVIALEIVREIQPTKVVVAWDKAKTSIRKRKEIYPDYKAGRTKPPEDFFTQIPMLRELVDALGWGFLECDDYEADDIIGTLAKQADAELDENGICDWDTVIVSSDLDMLQVVDDNTRMYRLLKGFSKLEEMDVLAVEEKYGILKSQFLDLKALKGDASDNIPGVPGVGEKTAVGLLQKYGTLENIYAEVDKAAAGEESEIKGATLKKLIDGRKSAFVSKELATIMTDAPVKLEDVPDLVIKPAQIEQELDKLEFRSLKAKFKKELEKARGNALSEFRIDESDEATSENETPEVVEINTSEFDGVIIENDVKKKMHEDPSVAEQILKGVKYWDLTQADFLLNPLKRVEMDEAAQGTLDFDKNVAQDKSRAAEQKSELTKYPKLMKVYTDFDLPLIPVLYKMEKRGVMISREYFVELAKEYSGQVAKLEQEIYDLSGTEFNVNSPIQLADVLFNKLRLPTKGIKKTARGFSTGAKELEKLREFSPVIAKIMEYREAAKLLSTYIAPLPELADAEDRVHTTFTQDVTATGRLSSVAPNLQNIPVRTEEGRRIRAGFVAPAGRVLVSADYSQFELRLAAVLSGDKALVDDFNSGVDIHTKTAADVFNIPMDQVTKAQRRAAKTINFGVMYGMSAKGLADATGMNVGEAKQFIEDYFEVRKPIREYLDSILKQAREEGFVETYFGRRRPTPDVKSSNFVVRQAAERAAQNMPIQGTEADLMKRAMIKVDALLPKGAELILQVHDSMIVECDTAQAEEVSKLLQETMEGVAPELNIKLAVEVTSGANWGEL